jgi:hypothetical protein
VAADSKTDETDVADDELIHPFIRFIRYQNPLPTPQKIVNRQIFCRETQ